MNFKLNPTQDGGTRLTRDKAAKDIKSIDEAFAWRDRTGQWHFVKNMETRHLFYTLRMIWNHNMPSSTRMPGSLYSFGPTYTRQYMIAAIKAIVPELEQRKDMTPEWNEQLQRMKDWLLTPQLPNLEALPLTVANIGRQYESD